MVVFAKKKKKRQRMHIGKKKAVLGMRCSKEKAGSSETPRFLAVRF